MNNDFPGGHKFFKGLSLSAILEIGYSNKEKLGGGFKDFSFSTLPDLGKYSNLTVTYFSNGLEKNHQPEKDPPFLEAETLQDTTHSSWSNICEELEISGVSWSRISWLKKNS